ncbi:DNA polymerase-3 subunit epsilon [Neomicrococcus aestuarii]|uniref:DNA polymerase-3 subunit epsilon n=1 Tax=Neomicrococcus aestuarii TaxID=556325 RepID=A0A7W8X0X5_9MICC|nr:3'-5' exonuclease [Neomicrococcus aestuarii]MBB5513697.1 DNA polymerase-3 subunit epsilon [Neomicrococcus aestuarii]
MNNWHELPRAAFDLETTGRDPHAARIVTASILVVNAKAEILQHREWLVNPGVRIPEEASDIHGVTTEIAERDGMDPRQAVTEISEFLDALFQTMPVMVFNAPYDFTVLRQEAERYGVAQIDPRPVIDPFIIDKQVDKYRRGKRTLVAISEFYQVPLINAHTSVADAAATIAVADRLAEKYPKELQIDPLLLHSNQIEWSADQAASFQEYLRRRDPSAVVDGEWPLKQQH